MWHGASADLDCGMAAIEVEANQDALAQSGQWGVQTVVFEGERFFGEDRIDTLRWRLGTHGLQREGSEHAA
jgi:2-hydroxychromene-2-carboxylate isomerase